MKPSLSARVAAGLVAQMVVFAAASGWVVWASESVFERVSVLKDDLEPAVDDLRKLLVDLKTLEGYGPGVRPADAGRVRGLLPRMRIFERMRADLDGLHAASGRLGAEARAGVSVAIDLLNDLIEGDRLLSAAAKTHLIEDLSPQPRTNEELHWAVLKRLDVAPTEGGESEAEPYVRELLRHVRVVRSLLVPATNRAVGALRDANADLFDLRSELSLALVLVPAGAMLAAILLLLLSLRTLKPLGELVQSIRRLAGGDFEIRHTRTTSSELAELSEALSSLAAALRTHREELARNEAARMQAERLAVVGRMASVVAHEVRNPLNSIALNTDLLRDLVGPDTDPAVHRVLSAVQGEVDRLSEITEEYLRFGRLPKGVLAPCDAVRVARDTIAFMASELASAGIETSVSGPDGGLLVLADEGQLRQAILNIVRNAREAMPGGGRIVIDAGRAGDSAWLSVADSGGGIPLEFRERLFEPFATTKARGTGLGLAFVKQVMHESGGDVSIESVPGQGTTVRLVLRLAAGGTGERRET